MSLVSGRADVPAGRMAAGALPLFVGAMACLGMASGLPLLRIAANRLVVGTPVSTLAALGGRIWLIAGLCLLGGLLWRSAVRSRAAAFSALAAFAIALVLFATGVGTAAADLVAGQPQAARARLASGAWIGLLLLSGFVAASATRTRVHGAGWLTLAAVLAAFVLLYRSGIFDGLSLAVEYRARADSVRTALVQHVVLSAAAVVLSALLCVLLYAWRPGRGVVEIAVNGLQVVPAVALLGGLVAMASGLLAAFPALRSAGLTALGPGPAILAVAAYLLLPFWRGLQGALRAPDPATLDAAGGIGLTRGQTLRGVRLPLGASILVGALRVASVQSIGLATLGALIGAGGLGGIVFDGMAQFAPDLILLGALPVIGLSLIVERALSLLESQVRQRWHG